MQRIKRIRPSAHVPLKIGQNIKKFRTRLRISQETLSKWAELTVLTVIKVESGRTANPSLFTIKKLANALGVTVDDLLY